MAEERRVRHSLSRRITLTSLLIFLVSIWALSYFASTMLREDMERLLADQQSSTVSYVAAELNAELEARVLALEKVARTINQAMLDHPVALQQMLENRLILQGMFNSGVVAVSQDGTAIADVPVVAGRRGTSYASNVATYTALTDGISVIGRPLVGRVLKQPLFNINAPIRDDHGKVIGALFGVISLTKPNFLDLLWEHRYGKSGGYIVQDLQHNLIVTASDKSRVLQALPAPGANEMYDKRRQGFTASAVAVNSLGVEVLSSAARIPAAGWLVVAALPTAEAFAPIRDMQQRIVLVTILLTLIVGAISWWLLRRQFAPLRAAVESLAGMADASQPLQPLLIKTRDEIGQLVGGFNRLLLTLGEHQAQLKTERDFFSAVLQQSSDGVLLFDPDDSRIQEVNPSICCMLGYEREELLARNYSELLDTDLESITENVRHIRHDKIPTVQECKLRKKDGTLVAVEVNAGLVETGDRQLIMVNIRDVTERQQLEHLLRANNLELEHAKVAAEKANLAKSEFLASMSHELRTPLNAVLGFAQLMEAGTPPPSLKQKPSIDQILKGGWHLLGLINEILDLAKIEAGKVTLSQESMSLSQVLEDCQALIASQACQREIQVTFPRFENPLHVFGDQTGVKQVMLNLLSNAIKYNRVGGAVMVHCAKSGANRLRVSVEDTGDGLTPQQLAQLFQPFNRLGKERGTEEGTGIGLVITKQLVELMGGVVGVESSVGVGSVFWFELAAASAPKPVSGAVGEIGPAEPDQLAPQQLSCLRTLLYVEDNPASLALVEQLMALRSDWKLLTAIDGDLGIQLARACQPDVILMDTNLPGINGYDALRILREDPATAHIPVMALSASAIPRDIAKGLAAGFFRYMTKPIKVNELMQALDVAFRYAAENRQTT